MAKTKPWVWWVVGIGSSVAVVGIGILIVKGVKKNKPSDEGTEYVSDRPTYY